MVNLQLSKAQRLAKRGKPREAAQIYNDILKRFPQNHQAKTALSKLNMLQNNTSVRATSPLGETDETIRDLLSDLFMNGHYDELIKLVEEYLPIVGDDYEIYFLAGATQRLLFNYNEAMYFLNKCLDFKPFDSKLHTEIGYCLYDSGDIKNAFKALKHASKLDPKNNVPVLLLAKMYGQIENQEKALEYYENAVAINASDRHARNEYGRSLHHFGYISEAINQFEFGLLQPTLPGEKETEILLHINLINALGDIGELNQLEKIVRRADKLIIDKYGKDQVPAVFNWNLALGHLILGETIKGYEKYRLRFEWDDFPSHKRTFLKPRLGSIDELAGKRLMIWREQGIGDELTHLFLLNSFLKKIDADIVIEVSERLVSVLKRSFPKLEIRAESYDAETYASNNNDFDFELPMGDMAALLNFNWEKSHLAQPYIKCDTKKVNKYKSLFDNGKKIVGLAWSSGFVNTRRLRHYSKLKDWEPLILSEKITVVNLQYGPIQDSLESLQEKARTELFLPKCDLKNDMDEVFAIIKNCDLVICPTTSLMIQGAALGIETVAYSPIYLPACLDFNRGDAETFFHPSLKTVTIHKFAPKNKIQTIEQINKKVIDKFS